ncbi:MAG: hypothetical protein PHU23_00110 [Dehalococcoidales bacterium]|nr:hypothetical protein [Dehalococcoidales bacterium]
MQYSEIDRFMQETGLVNDPAFDYLHFLNEPINMSVQGKTILGLYYSDPGQDKFGYIPPSTIHLPPNADYQTLLHELGHRVGDYYYGDLSEQFAESYRKARQGLIPRMYLGSPKSDAERALSHYGISLEDYYSAPENYPLPERGTGMSPAPLLDFSSVFTPSNVIGGILIALGITATVVGISKL